MALAYGDVTIVVDEQDDLFYTQAALQAHRPGEGRITVQPTPASASPAALAHDMLYALGKRLAPGPHSPDVWLDSVNAAWLAAAAWGVAIGVRHVVVPRAHLLTLRRIDQLLAWRELTGSQLTLLWQTASRGLPPVLARAERRISGRDQFEALLAEPGPIPARPFFPPAPPMAGPSAVAVAAGQSPAWQPRETRAASLRPGQPAPPCTGAMTTAQLVRAAPALEIASEEAAALAALAHPLIAGALSVLAFTRAGLGSLRFTRDLDITGDVCAIKLHGVGHRYCPLHAVPAWARPLLAGARAHHRLTPHPPGDGVFGPVMLAEARHLRTHAGRLPRLDLSVPADTWLRAVPACSRCR
ncbi:hypothetical protein [Streptomyces tauricus]|uniref:hypothetical protein n=1 Tax=Streptomyces tauricus TaxID=68274 RepID=UPI0022444B35|nr:hypothetical protein [Streptomyces tauricus]MCW8103452.1 hypothetical protein [Streptomyces tauricus]